MRRILIGLIALAVLAGGGWLGFNLYVQHRATAEVEAAFDQIRAGGGKASHGKIGFDLPTRTLTIEDVAVDPGQQSQMHVKIAGVKAIGVRQLDEMQFSADAIDVSGIEFAIDSAVGPSQLKAVYKIPQATIRHYTGAIRAQALPASNDIVDLYRFGLAQFSSVTASSIEVPNIAVTVAGAPGTARPGGSDFAYSGLVMRNLRGGKVEATKADRFIFTFNMVQPGKPGKLTAELSNLAMSDFDAAAMLATFDPQTANDDSYHQVYGQLSTGAYTIAADGMRLQIDGFAIDNIGVQPSKFRMAEMLAALPQDQSPPPTPAQSREMIAKVAGFYEGLRVGKIAIGKISMGTPQGTGSVRAIRYQEGEFAVEGLDAPSPQGRFKMERFALKSLSVANLLRWAASLPNPGQPPSPDQMLGLFRVFDGAEIKGVVSPYKRAGQFVTIDTIGLSWGQLVGPIPSRANLIVKMVAPTDPANPNQMPLVAAGIDKLAIDLDLGAAWTESSNTFALAPVNIDLGNLATAQARLALANVPRTVFTSDLAQGKIQPGQIEAGAIELSLRDNGAIDLLVSQFARMQNVGRDAARKAIVDGIKAQREQIATANPDAGAAVDAIARFVETPGQTLSIKLTPLGKVPVVQLIGLLKSEPITALAQFRIEASTGL